MEDLLRQLVTSNNMQQEANRQQAETNRLLLEEQRKCQLQMNMDMQKLTAELTAVKIAQQSAGLPWTSLRDVEQLTNCSNPAFWTEPPMKRKASKKEEEKHPNFSHSGKTLDSKLLMTSESRFDCQKALSMPSTSLLQAGPQQSHQTYAGGQHRSEWLHSRPAGALLPTEDYPANLSPPYPGMRFANCIAAPWELPVTVGK
ncbi:UNVERIFIED_CONTAM: hypothetical protein FKN15_037731 [Acipenser sinensis]